MSKFSSFDFLGIYNKSYKSSRINSRLFNDFLDDLKNFYNDSDSKKDSEENLKIKFAQYLLGDYHFETDKNRVDLTIVENQLPQVLCEFKTPKNKSEMLQCDDDDINKKSLHETIWYFFNQNSLDISYGIKNIVITDTDQFFFFNPKSFTNKHLERICTDFKNGKLAIKTTEKLYPLIGQIISSKGLDFDYCCIDLRSMKKRIKLDRLTSRDLDKLKLLFKLLHRNFLLREFNPKDANELNENFYRELLYIFGLKETKEKGKVKIGLSEVPETIGYQIKNTLNCEKDEDAIKLLTIWLNRILFLKLFEGQLISFNQGNRDFAFLSSKKVRSFSSLNNLFFNVLGKSLKERTSTKDQNIPYLNSSLFELHALEGKIGRISNLQNEEIIQPYTKTILRKFAEKKDRNILEYLLDFLDSYSFTSVDDSEHKEIINSAVLGLIFEKLNGYKDGSFFTPGYVTEFMAKNAIDRVVISKFNAAFPDKAKSETIEDVESLVSYDRHKKDRRDFYNSIIDSIRVCDPACGSGHFLVSVLNYLVYLKSFLGLLPIANEIEIHNDSLVVFDSRTNEQFVYQRYNKESTKIQRTLFNEKANIIKNCLFGVDINPNSVEICRLRLWIELLKNAYYKDGRSAEGEMALLPNIDINIKCGNSLISAYPPNIGNTASPDGLFLSKDIRNYQTSVWKYKNEESKSNKKVVVQQIQKIKDQLFGDLFSDVSLKDTLEWMVEFPEVLDDKGIFKGFDLVIGNPPYGVSIKEDERKLATDKLGKVPGFEIYYFFISLAEKLTKKEGIVSLIIPNSILFNTFAKDFRNNLLNKTELCEILDCSNFRIFSSAVVWNAILVFRNQTTGPVGYRNTSNVNSFGELIGRPLQSMSVSSLKEMGQNWSLAFRLDANIKDLVLKIKQQKCNLKDIFPEISQGLIAYDKYQGQSEETIKNRSYHFNTYHDGLKKWLWGEDVKRWSVCWNGKEYIDYCTGIANPRKPEFFCGKRMLVREITNPSIYAAWTCEELYNDPSVLIVKDANNLIEVLTGIINSKLATFFHFNFSPKASKGGFPKILIQDLKTFPLPDLREQRYALSVEKIRKIVSSSEINEDELNEEVYRLYGLTEEEVRLIEDFCRPLFR